MPRGSPDGRWPSAAPTTRARCGDCSTSGRELMARCGTTSRPRVADIVAAAGLSNDAFYRHFSSKDALVAAILEDGTERLTSYLAHQMAKEPTPERQVRRWVDGRAGPGGGRRDRSRHPRRPVERRQRGRRPSVRRGAAGRAAARAVRGARADASSMRRWPRTPCSACCPTTCGARPDRRARTSNGSPRSCSGEAPAQLRSGGIQLAGRFSMKACMPSRGSSAWASAQNIVW